MEVKTESGSIKNIVNGNIYKINPLPDFIQKIISLGGLKEYVKEEVKRRNKNV